MNNIERNSFDLVWDTMINRRKNLEGKFDKYSEQDKGILRKIIAEQKEEVENQRNGLSDHCYKALMDIYNGLELLLDNNVI